jgi:DNA-binding PucR family transcriptional regulator
MARGTLNRAVLAEDRARAFAPNRHVLALGTPAAGADGFRLSHRKALEVARVLRRTGAPLGTHDEVSVDALVLRDERTIYRLATIEQKLGRQLGARRIELGVALRLHATLSG